MNQPGGPAGQPNGLYTAEPGFDANTGYGQPPNPQATAVAALSQQSPASDGTNGRKRKASGISGSRGVANLTPEQLAKKRANDRDAQRAIRLRTKNTIDNLEQRIRELESQQPFQELQRVVAERDRAIAACEELQARFKQIQALAGTDNPRLSGEFTFDDLVDPSWLNEDAAELASLTAQQSPLPPLSQHHHQPPQYGQATSAGAPSYAQHHLDPDLRSLDPSTNGSPVSQASTAVLAYGNAETSLRNWAEQQQSENQPHYQSHHSHEPDQPSSAAPNNGERLGLSFLLESSHNRTTPAKGPDTKADQKTPDRQIALYSRLPINTAPEFPMDSLLADFIANQHKRIAAGAPVHEVLGPEYPSFNALYDPGSQQREECHPVSALLIDILPKFPDIASLQEKTAVLYIMFLIMRWSICPCERCYDRLPEWMRPLPEQLDIPHATWIDHLPWPSMRRALSTTSRVSFDDFFVPYTTTLSLNWPYPSDQVLIPADSSTNGDGTTAIQMNPVFETHLRDLNHWSLGTAFATAHPDLIDGVRIQDVVRH